MKPVLRRGLTSQQIFWPLVGLALLLLFNFFFTKDFFLLEIKDGHLYGSLVDILNRASVLMLLTIGMTLVIASGGIDISVGSVMAIASSTVAVLLSGKMAEVNGAQQFVSNFSLGAALLLTLGLALVLGIWNGVLVSYFGLQAIVATLILLVAGRGIAQLITSGNVITVYHPRFFYIGGGFLLGLPVSIFIVGGVFLLIMLLLKKTPFGLFLETVGINRVAARFSGINVPLLTLICYSISGVCAAMAGILVTSEVRSSDPNTMGNFIELDAILAFAIAGNSMAGGKFSMSAAMIGALIIQTIRTTIYSRGVAPEIMLVVNAVIVIVICSLQSDRVRAIFAKRQLSHGRAA
ncbi:MAG TPA: ABC transporter permease [Chloroflexota bacterium]